MSNDNIISDNMNNNNKSICTNCNRIYVCSDCIEGIFSAIYDIFTHVSRHETTHDNCKIIAGEIGNFELFSEYIDVKTDNEKALKVTRKICDRFGFECYQYFLYAASCNDDKKADAIYKSILTGLRTGAGFKLLNMWTDKNIAHINILSRSAFNEFASWREFLQFHELSNNTLFSRIAPKCDILMFLSSHFANRFPNEDFMIYDEVRDKYLVHEKQKECVIIIGNGINPDEETYFSDEDIKIDKLFKIFTSTIAIKERMNKKLQQQLIPLRIQNYKIEF